MSRLWTAPVSSSRLVCFHLMAGPIHEPTIFFTNSRDARCSTGNPSRSGRAGSRQSGAGEHNNSPQSESARRIEAATAAAMAMQRRDWEQGTLAQAMVEAGDRHNTILLTKAAIVQKTPDGRLGVVVSGSPTDPGDGRRCLRVGGRVDRRCRDAAGRRWTAHLDSQRRAAQCGRHSLSRLSRCGDVVRRLELCAALPRGDGIYDEALAQIEGYRQRLWNPDKKLLAHIWDDQKKQFKDGNFWGGGNGWAAAGWPASGAACPASDVRTARISPILRESSSMAVSRASVPTAYFTTWSISPRPSSRPTSLRCSPSRSMKESRPAGFPPPIVPTRTGCAWPLG